MKPFEGSIVDDALDVRWSGRLSEGGIRHRWNEEKRLGAKSRGGEEETSITKRVSKTKQENGDGMYQQREGKPSSNRRKEGKRVCSSLVTETEKSRLVASATSQLRPDREKRKPIRPANII